MTRSGNSATVTMSLEQDMALGHKYTRGSWSSVEKLTGCLEGDNRLLAVQDPGGGKQAVSDTVAAWADLCTP